MNKAIQQRLLFGFLAISVLVVGALLLNYQAVREHEAAAGMVQHTLEVRNALETTLGLLTDAESGTRGYVITEDVDYLAPFDSAKSRLAENLAALRALTRDNAVQQSRLETLEQLIEQQIDYRSQLIELVRSSDPLGARALILGGSGKAAMDRIRELGQEMWLEEETLLKNRQLQARGTAERQLIMVAVVTVVVSGILLFSFLLLRHYLGERFRAEMALRESEENLSVTLNSIGDAVLATDMNGRIVRLNPIAESLTGWSATEAMGRSIGEVFRIVSEETRLPAEIPVAKVLETGAVVELANHTVLIARDGRERPIADSASPIRNSEGALLGVVLVFRDVSAERAAALELKARAEALASANKELETFSYSVSHDLRAPLRSIDGFSLALLEDYAPQLDDTAKNYLHRVRMASQRMAKLIDDLLNLSRLTMRDMQRKRVDLTAMAEAVLAELREAHPSRTVEVQVSPGLMVEGDPELLRVVLHNLVGNAWKFTGKTEGARIEFGSERHNGVPAFFVRDNGAGFDMAHAERLFTPFQRLHRVDEFEGTGVGLATIQRIIHRHGGHIWAEGEVGKGAKITFTLEQALH